MSVSNFQFLAIEWPDLFSSAAKAESLAHGDTRASCFYARRTLELAVGWLYRNDSSLKLPYQEHLSALIHEPTFKSALGIAVFNKVRLIKEVGNRAVHSQTPIRQLDAISTVRELFHFLFWLARTYSRTSPPPDTLAFNPALLPQATSESPKTLEQLQKLQAQLAEKDAQLAQTRSDTDAEIAALKAEIAEAKKRNQQIRDDHDYSEAETRDYFIDLLLKEAGWPLDKEEDREYPVHGMPNESGEGFVDYVLWGDDGKSLGLVEAKRTKREPRVGQQQAKLYADCLEKKFGQRPIIFYSNGYDTWIWDDLNYPPRAIQGFYKKDELELLIQRRKTRKSLEKEKINPLIVERYYQTRAIRKIGESFEKENERKALIVMATGAGKTRTVIALCELLQRCNWAKRILFLADRVALVDQAIEKGFKPFLPESSPVNLVKEREKEGRVYVSTYPTMMGLIDEAKGGTRRFGVGHFDLVIIDEAHRSVYQKYRAIFAYFDSLLVGLTATPKDEIDHNTYSLFDLEDGVPTDAYTLEEAVKDGFLVPPKPVSVPLRFLRQGITYDDLPEEEKEKWDELEWTEEGDVPDRVEAEAINKWLFNIDTVDKVLEHLMTKGLKVAGGDRIGKTIIFAKNHQHALFIQERFDKNYPKLKGAYARVIDFETEYVKHLIDNFYIAKNVPHIAISVDMLDTGIDVPEVVNLVFFKIVRSKTKFFQMIGRGTRLCTDLFGPDKPKEFFFIFDYCQNLEFFKQNAEGIEGSAQIPLGKKLFLRRLEILEHFSRVEQGKLHDDKADKEAALRIELGEILRAEVAAMNMDNFVVRPKRKYVEKYREEKTWRDLQPNDYYDLASEVAGLPSELDAEEEEAKRFDLIILNLQLAVLKSEPTFERLRDQVTKIASLLAEKESIPMVKAQMPLITDLQTAEFWQDITLPILENVRKRLRELVKLIDKKARKPVYSDFVDEMGTETEVSIPGVDQAVDFVNFRKKLMNFLKDHENHIALKKLRYNKPITKLDLEELDRLLFEAGGVGSREQFEKTFGKQESLGLFIRSLVGLDRGAAKAAFGKYLERGTLNSNQVQFINYIIDFLAHKGVIEPKLLYESPFTDLNSTGLDGLFADSEADNIVHILQSIRQNAAA